MIQRGYRYKLKPTPAQERLFAQSAGVCRLIYNLALEQRRDHWRAFKRQTGSSISYPSPRKKGRNDTFRFQGREVRVRKLNGAWSEVRLPKIGWVRFRDTRPLRGKVNNATISLAPNGWHVSFAPAIEHDAPANIAPAVGVDRGVANTLALSTGERISVPASLAVLECRQRRAQKVLSRRKRGSKRYAKTRARVSALSVRRARIRKDWHRRVSLDLARRFGTVVLEDLNTKSMTTSAKGTVDEPGRNVRQKAGLNRATRSRMR
ncbi:RNA-guided endonuclease InsQ/TnpB family protein [Celeribacter sp.]|uniref:RNA-guided endonuclease InsQ/TnpB family protein n=1 Tax=Celeribacter sp. TaxID=1890673 RepID=UPI003A90C992